MKKVFWSAFKDEKSIDGYYIDSINYDQSFLNERGSIKELILGGLNTWKTRKSTRYPEEFHRLYREKHPAYMRYIEEFLDKYMDYDILIMAAEVDLIHPEILEKYFKDKVKILTFIDDPHASYSHGTPYLWAFDAAYYISPSYSSEYAMEDMLNKWGSKNNYWLPLSGAINKNIDPNPSDEFFRNRVNEIVYIGGYYGSKVDRLIKIKKHFKDKFNIYGRFPFKGHMMSLRGFMGKPFLMQKISSLSDIERDQAYFSTKIGFNLHLNEIPNETGNARMYEVPSYGLMQISSKAGLNLQNKIFKNGEEIVYYDNLDHAIELMEYYLENNEERVRIAKNGYNRVLNDYIWHDNVKKMLDWASLLK